MSRAEDRQKPAHRQARTPRRRLGNLSLAIMAGGMILFRLLIHLHVLVNPWWDVLATGFEAGTIGALADWYAVTALFREIRLPPGGLPIPFLTRHSNLILRNRARITDNIADMVENRWLSPEAIARQLELHDPADELLRYFDDPAHLDSALDLLRRFLHLHASGIGGTESAAFIERILRDQLGAVRFAQPLGGWVRSAIERGDQHVVWDVVLDTMAAGLGDRNLHAWLGRQVQTVAKAYAGRDLIRLVAKTYGELTGAIHYPTAALRILQTMDRALQLAKAEPRHPIRLKLDQLLLSFAARLAEGEPQATAAVEHAWAAVTQHAELRPLVNAALDRLSQTLSAQTESLGTPLMQFIRNLARRQLDALRNSPEDRQRLSQWVRDGAISLVSARRHLIGDTVRLNLAQMADAQWSSEIQQKVGDDLQWIRVNGALVGFLAGLALSLAKHLVGMTR